jgi:serine/threonine-protein phosphatase 6 regulatory ankyrin repeat subunit B
MFKPVATIVVFNACAVLLWQVACSSQSQRSRDLKSLHPAVPMDQHDAKSNKNADLVKLISLGDIPKLERHLKTGTNPNESESAPPIIVAAASGQLDAIRLLVNYGALVDAADDSGKTALMYAASRDYVKIVRFLVQSGAHVNVRDTRRWTALHYAVSGNAKASVEYLIDTGSQVNEADSEGETALLLAAHHLKQNEIRLDNEKATRQIIALLLDQGASVNRLDRLSLIAVEARNIEAARLFLKHGANPNVRDDTGSTPLNSACLDENEPIASLLLSFRADPNVGDDEHCTPLHHAARLGNAKIAALLLKHGANAKLVTGDHLTAHDLALRHGHPELAELLTVRSR